MKKAESISWPTAIIVRRFYKLNPKPKYQRGSVWSRSQKQLLIDSIIRNMDIPKLYFRLATEDKFDYEIIDGQQRIRTLYEFKRNLFRLSPKFTPEYGDKFYIELPEEVKDKIDLYQFDITVIDEATDEEIQDMFYRLQNGKPLNAAEKRNAVGGNMRDFISELVNEHPLFEVYERKNSRFSFEQMAAQCILLELTGTVTDVKNAQLDRMYRSYQDFDPQGAEAKRIKRIMNYLAKAFRETTPEFKGRAQFVSLYWLVSRLIDTYSMTGHEGNLREFYIDFETRRALKDTEELDFIRYSEALSHSSDGRESIQYRHDMLVREWLLYVPTLTTKDPQRKFNEEQRIAIYRRDAGICQVCGGKVGYHDYEADHVVPHSKGGPTTVANGQTTHEACNSAKSNHLP